MAGAKFAAREIELSENKSGWLRAHEALWPRSALRQMPKKGDGYLLALRSAVHVHLGFGSFGEYVERLFGYRPRSTQEKLRVAAALEQLPAMAQALAAGALSWSAVRELSREAAAQTEREWLELSKASTRRAASSCRLAPSWSQWPSATVSSWASYTVLPT